MIDHQILIKKTATDIQSKTRRYKEVTAAIEEEDKLRELYSLAGNKKEQVEMPKFGGGVREDLSTFKAKLLLAFEKNMVSAADKVEKLRACLSGAALALVPEKTHDFNKALKILKDAFENPERALAARLGDIKKPENELGKCPPETEVLLQDLLD